MECPTFTDFATVAQFYMWEGLSYPHLFQHLVFGMRERMLIVC